jgi:hypothetical protein
VGKTSSIRDTPSFSQNQVSGSGPSAACGQLQGIGFIYIVHAPYNARFIKTVSRPSLHERKEAAKVLPPGSCRVFGGVSNVAILLYKGFGRKSRAETNPITISLLYRENSICKGEFF